VLQGPPGTGKTTVARLLADQFNASLRVTTATAEWSTYDMVGGLRPTETGALLPVLGEVAQASLECARIIRQELQDPQPKAFQARWLLVDELNRADIDKSVGPLYTVLSSISGDYLEATPLNLWYETGERAEIWIPSRFRLLATMNDVDTSFVNAISQGLTRRFQFIFLGVPTSETEINNEVDAAFATAYKWLVEQYAASLTIDAEEDLKSGIFVDARTKLVQLLRILREPIAIGGWPLGTAQIVDVWRSLLLAIPNATENSLSVVDTLDVVFADRIVPQMGDLDDDQLREFETRLKSDDINMLTSASAIHHLRNTRATQ